MEVLSIEPALYLPFSHGKYDVKPGLARFGKDFGIGRRDQQLFQRDRLAHQYADEKRATRRRGMSRCYCRSGFDQHLLDTVCDFIEARLKVEHPVMMRGARLEGIDRFDSLALLVQEDLCVIRVDAERNWLAAAHLCFPNGWSPAEKIGRDFAAIHEPVPHIESINAAAREHALVMMNAVDGLVRFAWGLQFHDELDKHPDRSDELAQRESVEWAHVRVERQTIWGLPTVRAALFTIRTYLYRCDLLPAEAQQSLADAVESMSPQSVAYKGLETWSLPLVGRLRGG